MSILFINGSLNKNGNTVALAQTLLKGKEYETLNLILQPLLENAIGHGIDVKTDGRGEIRIEGKENGDFIDFTVSDNGVGMTKTQAALILSKSSNGYGVSNVNERIKLYYGEKYAVKIESTPARK